MSKISLLCARAAVALIAAAAVAAPALADKPSWAGEKGERGRAEAHEREQGRDSERRHEGERAERREHFGEHHRTAVREYYGEAFRAGRCPRGLAKKHDGCMPPGQARKWELGRPLPHDVVFYDVPPALVVKLGPPPSGYRYVRVAGDILLIAIGTSMVMDAIRDLGR